MFSTNLGRTVCAIKGMVVPIVSMFDYVRDSEGAITTPGMLMTLDLRLSHYSTATNLVRADLCKSKTVYFLFTGTTVWVGYETADHRMPSFENYKFLSSHDSCWKDAVDSELCKIYNELADNINYGMEKLGLKGIAPKDMNDNSSLGWLGDPWKVVGVTWKFDPKDSYKKILVKFD